MNMFRKTLRHALFAFAITLHFTSNAASVRVSFLTNFSALSDTITIVTNNGCSVQSTEMFAKVVLGYYSNGFNLDLSKFPSAQNGFYSFNQMREVVSALPHRLCDTDHSWDFNCFDTAILLSDGQMSISLKPDENFGIFLVSTLTTNGENLSLQATARDAFEKITQGWYRDITQQVFSKQLQDARICLTATLFRWRLVPAASGKTTVKQDVFTALCSDWRRAGVKFPDHFQVVLYHKSGSKDHMICTHHVGLLLHRKNGYTYLEKSGGKGPFVRLDFEDKSDLLTWASSVFSEREHKNAYLFVTFNDSEIAELH